MINTLWRWSAKHIFLIAISLLVAAQSLMVFDSIINNDNVIAAGTNCGQGVMVQIGDMGGQNNVTGIVPVYLAINTMPTFLTNGISKVEMRLDTLNGPFLGYAKNVGTGTTTSPLPGALQNWQLMLPTNFIQNNQHNIIAIGSDGGPNYCFSSNSTPVIFNNTNNSETLNILTNKDFLSLIFTPTSLDINLNSILRRQKTDGTNEDVTQYARFSWQTTFGTLIMDTASLDRAVYRTPTVAGSGYIVVTAEYASISVSKKIPIIIKLNTDNSGSSSTVATTQNTTTTVPVASSTESTEYIAPNPVSAITTATNKDKNCIEQAIGVDRFNLIQSGSSKPTREENEKLKVCYYERKNIIPTAFAPVKPEEIKHLSISSRIKAPILKNKYKDIAGVNKEVLTLNGKVDPLQDIYVYIFSTPLVLTTKADNEGNWSYTLEDPLDPGSHEVYTVVDRGDGNYQKSNPFAFVIGRAEASAENPNGLSLKLESTPEQNNRVIYLYVTVVLLLVIISIAVVAIYMLRRNKSKQLSNNTVVPPSITGFPSI